MLQEFSAVLLTMQIRHRVFPDRIEAYKSRFHHWKIYPTGDWQFYESAIPDKEDPAPEQKCMWMTRRGGLESIRSSKPS